MTDSVRDHLNSDMECEGLLECFYGLTELDREVFGVLARSETALTVDRIADAVDRERSTAYRSIRRLVDAGIVTKRQETYDQGGYYHVFEPAAADEVTDDLQRLLNDWYVMMGRLIDEFESKYDSSDPVAVDY